MIHDQHATVAGYRLRIVSELDRPGVPLLIFNGIGAAAGLLRPLFEKLSVPVITFDLPGIGGSKAALLPMRMHQFARLASDVLDQLDVDCCHVMGISWGGGLAQQFARQFPKRTIRLILAASSTGHLMMPPRLQVLLRMATPMRYLSADYFLRVAGDIYGGDFRSDPTLANRHVKHMTAPSMAGYFGQLFALSGWTSMFWLHEVQAPALVMAGDDDPIVPMVNAQILASRLPNARLVVFDCGHLFVLTRIDRVCAEIERFLLEDERLVS